MKEVAGIQNPQSRNLFMNIAERKVDGYELVLFGNEPESGYRGIIVIHSTALGVAIGGTRFWDYTNEEEALRDALRLSRGMTYKNALAGLPLGGGKSIIIGDNRRTDRETLFRAHGRFVESLEGRYITAEDVGTSPADMEYVRKETSHVAGLADRSGDPSPVTARGVFRAIQAAARFKWGNDDLNRRRVALQGCGNVGRNLARLLHGAGANLLVSDADWSKTQLVRDEFPVDVVASEEIYDVEADVFAPCALGGILNDETIPRLRIEIVAGAANNQLLEPRHGNALERRGIVYVPDFVANVGGVINGCIELLNWSAEQSRKRVDAIYQTVLDVLESANSQHVPANIAADRLAEERMRLAKPGGSRP
jgi:leucine dehydrogenase